MNSTEKRMRIIESGIKTMSTSDIVKAIREIGLTDDNDLRMARCVLFCVYEDRVGEQKSDELSEEIFGSLY